MIRNRLYIKHQLDISILAKQLATTLDELPGGSDNETLEETKIRHALFKAQEALEEVKNKIEYFSMQTKEGHLQKEMNDRFVVRFNDGTSSDELHCGAPLELYISDRDFKGWVASRVEFSDDYYLVMMDNYYLCTGMKARLRIKK